jgi:hypothetical protein
MSEMGRCRDCRWWTPVESRRSMIDYQERREGTGQCGQAWSKEGVPGSETTLAWAEDADEHAAVLITKPHFGCVQFQAKEGL